VSQRFRQDGLRANDRYTKRHQVSSARQIEHGPYLSPTQVRRVREYIRANLGYDIGLAELADQVSLSPHYFSLLFKHTVGAPPYRYLLRERIHEAQRLLAAGRISICEVALSVGFSDQSHFSGAFRKMTGTTPKRYQRTMNPGERSKPWATLPAKPPFDSLAAMLTGERSRSNPRGYLNVRRKLIDRFIERS
jgi:AraC-like DNA-binding protein